MKAKTLALGIGLAAQLGCGTVLQGKTQRIRIATDPAVPDAVLSVDGGEARAPATVEVLRKSYTVVRAAAPGYYDACQVVPAPIRRGFLTMDILFLFVPLLVDAAGGMDQLRRLPDEITMPLVPAQAGRKVELPPDSAIVAAFKDNHEDLCAPVVASGREKSLTMTTGDISVPYVILGTVHVQAEGVDAARATGPLLFRPGGIPAKEPEHEYVSRLLQNRALLQYGDQVDALINVSYHGDARSGDVSAEGLAVRFKERPAALP